MDSVKTLLENTRQDLKMKLWWSEEHDKEPQYYEEIPILKKRISDIDEVLSVLFCVDKKDKQTNDFRCHVESSSTGRCNCLKEDDCVWAD